MTQTVRHDVLRRAREAGIRMIRFVFCDQSAVVRGTSTHVRLLEDRLQTGITIPAAVANLSLLDLPAPTLETAGELLLLPDPDSFVPLPYLPGVGSLIADLIALDGEPWPSCPRGFLRRMLARLEAKDLRVRSAFAGEFSLRREEGGTFQPLNDGPAYGTEGMNAAAPLIDALAGALEAQGIPVEHYHAGWGPGQHALSVRHAEGLRGADNQVILRETIRAMAAGKGIMASFAPVPLAGQPRNSARIHLSLFSKDGRTAIFPDPRGAYGLSKAGRHWVAGVIAHLPAITALTRASVNSYRQTLPDNQPSWRSAVDGAAIRVAASPAHERTGAAYIELRSADHTANPYLALGALIAAGLDGIARERDLGEPASTDLSEQGQLESPPLPTSLLDALAALEADPILGEAMGAPLLASFLAIKRLEATHFAAQDAEYEIRYHRDRF